ncbi:MAG: hypothetical protein Q9163_006231 [Psora crenata]
MASASTEQSDDAHIILTVTTSTPTISLSASPDSSVLLLTVHAQRTGPEPITLCTAGGPLDNGQHVSHDGCFKGAFLPLTSIDDPTRQIRLHFTRPPNYGSRSEAINLLERDYLKFETIPGAADGELRVTHEITLERLFELSRLPLQKLKAGEIFKVELNSEKLKGIPSWWVWGALDDELKGKKFAKWERPDEGGGISNLMPGERMPDVEGMKREGWVFSELMHELKIGTGEGEAVVVEFVE